VRASTVLDDDQRQALDAPADRLVIVSGGPGSGKTVTLVARAAARIAADPAVALERYVVTSPLPRAGALRALVREAIDPQRRPEADAVPWLGGELATLAYAILLENAVASRLALDLALIDEAEAEDAFERAGASLFALEWTEFVSAEIDPELAGMRAPERFAAAALRLFRKLRAALITPDEFLDRALRGAVSYYATPPNFADPALLAATREEYRDSLCVDRVELERQRLREVDLAKVLGRLYQSYLDELVRAGCLTSTDAIAEATRLLEEQADIAEAYRRKFVAAFVDDTQDLTLGALRFLQGLFGKELAGVTLAGDRDQATQTLAGARPERIFSLPGITVELRGTHRMEAGIAKIARTILAAEGTGGSEAVRLFRAHTQGEEAGFIADEVAKLVAGGTAPHDVAVIIRSFVWMRPYRDALVAAGLPVTMSGSIDLYDEPDVEDALALLWSACDPFRHDYLLRALGTPGVALNDLGLYLLCGEPSNPQTALFELPDDGDSVRTRWDRRRNLRLALNVVRGDRDADLDDATREAVLAFRERRRRWEDLLLAAPAEEAAAAIIAEGGLRERLRNEGTARHALRDDLLDALVRRIAAFTRRDAKRTLHEFLQYVERASLGDRPPYERIGRAAGVAVVSIDAAKGREFDHVFVCNLRAGAFPAYYSPDSFLFSPTYGVIPKDNVGDAQTQRTAKFTWYSHHAKLKELYTGEDRRAWYCASSRARATLTLSASGRPTRGIGAPEFLAELQNARPSGVVDLSGTWKSARTTVKVTLAKPDLVPPPPGPALESILTVTLADLAAAQRCGKCARRSFLMRAAVERAGVKGPCVARFHNGIVADERLPDLEAATIEELLAVIAGIAPVRELCDGCAASA
jgi:superfamily I DNA/RNA helicase